MWTGHRVSPTAASANASRATTVAWHIWMPAICTMCSPGSARNLTSMPVAQRSRRTCWIASLLPSIPAVRVARSVISGLTELVSTGTSGSMRTFTVPPPSTVLSSGGTPSSVAPSTRWLSSLRRSSVRAPSSVRPPGFRAPSSAASSLSRTTRTTARTSLRVNSKGSSSFTWPVSMVTSLSGTPRSSTHGFTAPSSWERGFNKARFGSAERLGPIVVARTLDLDRAVFEQATLVEAAAAGVTCRRATFAKHATLRLRHATVSLDETTSSGPLTIAAAAEPFTASGQAAPMAETILDRTMIQQADGEVLPRLVSLAGVDAPQLVLTDVDLSQCYFEGAHHLDQLRLEGRCRFAGTPVGWRLWGWPPLWHWTRRQTIAEEHPWRASDRGRPVAWPAPSPPLATRPKLDPEHLAARYRQLRKAQEDAKNEPGAADFYYGEMEMRRRDAASATGERTVLALYWLLSG